ncbi:biotin-dependent carboxyltransferase family protein [uncultured Algibacter sp.]|uniref:5-oxoprolinase subunit C family protein n=1 Tax=uncultured Algibacter sp. TaxID=298659 RepID=UPI00260A4072|nr:biotin-dependent carboxyltransferase family protein [uncultured Algibacter sp.]
MIKVQKTGFYSTIQDFGRHGYQEYGVPYSGVMDAYSASLANVLLGNKAQSAVMEITMMGPVLEFQCSTTICISGADMTPKLNDLPLKLNKATTVKSGDLLSFGRLNYGFRTYLAVLGGFKTEKVMGSRSMYQGITKHTVITKNDELLVDTSVKGFVKQLATIKIDKFHLNSNIIEVLKGPEFEMLSKSKQELLFSKPFTISKDNNRMAYQLTEILPNNLEPIITSSVLPGAVQLTPSGKLIVLMRDCQTTGGYPRVLQLKNMAINILSQKFTGNNIRFKLIEF